MEANNPNDELLRQARDYIQTHTKNSTREEHDRKNDRMKQKKKRKDKEDEEYEKRRKRRKYDNDEYSSGQDDDDDGGGGSDRGSNRRRKNSNRKSTRKRSDDYRSSKHRHSSSRRCDTKNDENNDSCDDDERSESMSQSRKNRERDDRRHSSKKSKSKSSTREKDRKKEYKSSDRKSSSSHRRDKKHRRHYDDENANSSNSDDEDSRSFNSEEGKQKHHSSKRREKKKDQKKDKKKNYEERKKSHKKKDKYDRSNKESTTKASLTSIPSNEQKKQLSKLLGPITHKTPKTKISSDDYFTYHNHLRLYLYHTQKSYFEDLSSTQTRDAFESFCTKYNNGELEQVYYDSKMVLPEEALEMCKRTKHRWKFDTNQTERRSLDLIKSGVKKQTEYHDIDVSEKIQQRSNPVQCRPVPPQRLMIPERNEGTQNITGARNNSNVASAALANNQNQEEQRNAMLKMIGLKGIQPGQKITIAPRK